ncbi:MAG: peptide chain release factor N(5)-glutamine methyltransferase [Candidatus Omnitrophica bacterium]|nr:peptide chain release factor N(5)-glutamine methyltransferase [Candidatus Omnitrophota bacterium]
MPSRPASLVRIGQDRLLKAGNGCSGSEAEWILSHLLGIPSLQLHLSEDTVSPEMIDQFFKIIEERSQGAPLQYLLGHTEFYNLRLKVAPGVFIPRPETEHLVQVAVEVFQQRQRELDKPLRLLDLGCGSGAIALALAVAIPTCFVVAVEISWSVLFIARQNVQANGVSKRVQLIQGRWADAIRGPIDGIVANPPYIPSDRVNHLPIDVQKEPRLSLDGGIDGMDAYQEIFSRVGQILASGGSLVMECAPEQQRHLLQWAKASAWVSAYTPLQDLASCPRGILVTAR